MAIALSAEDKRIIADIERQLAERKKAKGGAKELEAELKKARKGRTVAKFNSKGQTVEKAKTKVKSTRGKPPTAKKPEAKKPEAKTKVKSTRGKPPTVKKPEAKKPTVKKPTVKKPTVKKPTVKKPTVKKPTVKKPTVKKPTVKKPTVKKPVSKLAKSLKKPKVKKTEAKKPTVKRTSARTNPKSTTSTANPNGSAKIKQRSARGKASSVGKSTTGNKSVVKANSRIKDVKGTNTTAKPKLLRGPSTIGPAGERIGGNPSNIKKGGKLASVGKNLLRFGPLAAVSAGSMLYNAVHPDEVKKRSGPSKAGFGTKKTKPTTAQAATSSVASTTDKKRTGESKAGFGTKKTKPTTAQAATSSVASTTDKKGTGDKQTATTSSFGAAFRKAKDAGQKIFTWPKGGKSYSTATKDDVKKSGSKDLRGHLNAKSGKKATSFGTAFKAAKKEGKKTFKFNGKSYSTKTK